MKQHRIRTSNNRKKKQKEQRRKLEKRQSRSNKSRMLKTLNSPVLRLRGLLKKPKILRTLV